MLHTVPKPDRRDPMAYSAANPNPQNILDRLKAAPQSFQLHELPSLADALYSLPEQLLTERDIIAAKINQVLEIFFPQLNLQHPHDDHQAITQLKFLHLCLVNDHADPVPYAPQLVAEPLATPHLNGHHSRRASERDKPLNQELVELFLCSLYKYPEIKTEISKGDQKFIMAMAISLTTGMINNRIMLSQVMTIFGIIDWRFYFMFHGNKAEQVYKFKIHDCLQSLSKYFPTQTYVRLMGNYQNLNFSKLNFSFYDLRFVKLSGTKLGTSFKSATNITGADFSYADVTKVWWGGCYVKDPNKLPIMTNTIGLHPNFMNDLYTHGIRPDLP